MYVDARETVTHNTVKVNRHKRRTAEVLIFIILGEKYGNYGNYENNGSDVGSAVSGGSGAAVAVRRLLSELGFAERALSLFDKNFVGLGSTHKVVAARAAVINLKTSVEVELFLG